MSAEGRYLGALGLREIFASFGPVERCRGPATGELPSFAKMPVAALDTRAHFLAGPKRPGPERPRVFLAAGFGAGIAPFAADKVISIVWNSEEAWGQ